jgi:YD repeat-containing protein
MRGELVIPGFSGYLHPISSNRLLGFGYGADNRLQLSLYDTTNPDHPLLIATSDLGLPSFSYQSQTSPITNWGGTHHAFTWMPDHNLIAIPVTDGHSTSIPVLPSWSVTYNDVFIHLENDAFSIASTIQFNTDVQRTIPIGDLAAILSNSEMKVVNLDDPSSVISSGAYNT